MTVVALTLAVLAAGLAPAVAAGAETRTVALDPREVFPASGAEAVTPFLPTPLSRPLVLPQQEGPGVVISTARDAAGEPVPLGIPGTVLGTDEAGRPLKLAHYAFGAYQRGLYNTAFDVALKAAAEDDADAAALIGRLYEEARGVQQDFEKAAGWYAVAADLGNAGAKTRLALMMLEGRGLPKDADKAADTFQEAAEAGDPDAAHSLSLMFLKGEGRQRDPASAFRYMRQAAEAGDSAAQYALAVMYEEGQGTVPDEALASTWYGRAARSGEPAAVLPYAVRLFNGIGVEADETAAARYFEIAAREGNPVAMNRYARILANGRGVTPNAVEAIKWHLLAREAGVSDLFLDGFMGTADPAEVAEARRRAEALAGG